MLEPVAHSPTTLEPPSGAGTVASNRSLRALKDLPGPRGLPVLGNLLQLDIARAHIILQHWADAFGPIYRFRIAHRNVVVISDNELINDVLRDRPGGFRRRKLIQEAMLELGINGVFGAEGLDWRRQRKLAMHALNTNHLRDFFGRLDAVTARLQRRWERAAESGERIDAQRDLMRFTVDVTTGLALGNDLNTLEKEGDTIQRHLDKVFPALARRLLSPIRYWRWVKLPADRELDAAMVEVYKLVNELVFAARERVARSAHAEPANLLDAMIAAQSDNAGAFTDAEIVGNTLTMLLAGEDTTANTLAWMMHLMAEHPEVQAKMQADADRALGDAGRAPNYTSTESLRYIEAVAHEAMRLKPVAPFLALEPNEDAVIGDVRVPKGTAVYLLTAYPATRAENFADPTSFRPERWLDAGDRAGEGHNTRAFLPFGAGPRFCPGRHLAMLEIKMVGAMLCRNFDVAHAPDSPPTEELFSFTMMPKNLFVTLQPRRA
ncbi:MAG: cytochrome P450 [Pseudomonadota bacterium]|nr:cytochrome P450 [Pseudomonadota bacterium]